MKNFKSLMLIFSVALILGAVLMGSCSAQTSTDYLKVKGEILNDYAADLYVYVQDESTGEWTKIVNKKSKKKYRLRLATHLNYQVVFVGIAAPTKVINIKAGNSGRWIVTLDIDYNDRRERNMCMYQGKDDLYVFQTRIEYGPRASLE